MTKRSKGFGGDEPPTSTVPPPFDPEEYARESESKLRAGARVPADERSGVLPVEESSGVRSVPILLADVPVLALPPAEVARLALDHRAGFVLSHVDGASSVENILDVSAMPHTETLEILAELVTRSIIVMR